MEIEKGSAQVEVAGPFGSVFLYAEEGKGIIGALHRALSKEKRWNDPDYLSRIIFCQMVPEKEWDGTNKFGIGTEMYANIDIFVTIDTITENITIQARGSSLQDRYKMSFQNFIDSFTSNARL